LPDALSQWSIVGAAVIGTSHANRGIPCQDSFRIWCGSHGIAVIAVADGAGSARHSNLGSAEAAELAIGALRAHFIRRPVTRPNIYEAIKRAFITVRSELEIYADVREIPLETLATTLTVAVLMPDCLAVAQTGDGLIVGVNNLGQIKAATRPQGGEYANETFFITAADGVVPRYAEVYTPVSALAVLTDGLLSVATNYQDHQPHHGFFEPMFTALSQSDDPEALEQQLAAFLQSDRVNARTDDDKTLVLAVRRGMPTAPGYST
jgi:serine/threonine protein phosphatase PrpC